VRVAACLSVALVLSTPALAWFLARNARPERVAERGQQLLAARIHALLDLRENERATLALRRTNAEWDFMSRTFLVLSLANLALADPASRGRHLATIDEIIADTLKRERGEGLFYFLMPYAQYRPFVLAPARSQFVDGEIALMLQLRRIVAEKPEYRTLGAERTRIMRERMEKSPVMCAESYPDECWTFCNTVALAAMKLEDALGGSDHGPFLARWVSTARARLVDPRTGLLASSYTQQGELLDGPEGSSIFFSAHMLALIDPAFAHDQYERAKRELVRSAFGFAWAAEWPAAWRGPSDVDSGPVLPLIDASAGSSGMALIGARVFDDDALYSELTSSLELGGFPIEEHGRLRYAAAGPIGDTVILYSAVAGPVWRRVHELSLARTRGAS
jgi:hypothetical protein